MQSAGRPRNVNPRELGPARGFSHATVAGDTVWLGGQIGSDASGRIVEPGDLVRQYARAIGMAYREVFGRHYPASTLIEVRSLFDPDALVEIEAVAVRRP